MQHVTMTVKSLTAAERETTVTTSDDAEFVLIWTAQARHITRLRKDAAFEEVASGLFGTSEWAEFRIAADRWSPAGVKRARKMTEAQKASAAQRLSSMKNRP